MLKIVAQSFMLAAKFPGLFVQVLYRRRAGVRAFERELLSAGMDPVNAALLAKSYKGLLHKCWKEAR